MKILSPNPYKCVHQLEPHGQLTSGKIVAKHRKPIKYEKNYINQTRLEKNLSMYQSFYENTRLYVFLILCSMIQPIAYVYILDSRYLAIYCNIIMVSNFIIMFLLEFIN